MVEGKPPTLPSMNPLERALTRVASAIGAQTSATEMNTAATNAMAQQLAQFAQAAQRADSAAQVFAEKVNSLIKLEEVARRDLAEIRQAMIAQGVLSADAAREAREANEKIDQWTPARGHRLPPPPADDQQDKVETWVGRFVISAGKSARHYWPHWIAASGIGAAVKHLLGWLHG